MIREFSKGGSVNRKERIAETRADAVRLWRYFEFSKPETTLCFPKYCLQVSFASILYIRLLPVVPFTSIRHLSTADISSRMR
jgi:hypothetical protein